ncbi:hypothetical protein B0J14DRAFT_682679 [Halenospora varia]|nr:hypothetical protein B0J14DRAFT_682679 [Halenospora varia]
MAIHPFHPGLSAQILTSNHPTTEYTDPDAITSSHSDPTIRAYEESATISRYITASTNQTFSIKLSLGPPHTNSMESRTKFVIAVDGVEADVVCAERAKVKRHGGRWEHVSEGVKSGKGRACREMGFRFKELRTNSNTIDNNQRRRLAERLEKVGTIEIKVWGTSYGKQGGKTPGEPGKFMTARNVNVPETVMKPFIKEAKSHTTVLGEAKKVKRGPVFSNTTAKAGEDYPLVIFRFLYRSEESLQQLQIIPRPPSPSGTPIPQSPSPSLQSSFAGASFSPAGPPLSAAEESQLERLLARSARGRSASVSVIGGPTSAGSVRGERSGNDSGSGSGGKRIKLEDDPEEERSRKRARRNAEPVHVDLTGDDIAEVEVGAAGSGSGGVSERENELFVGDN